VKQVRLKFEIMRYVQNSFPTTQEINCTYVSFVVLTVFLDVMSCSLVES